MSQQFIDDQAFKNLDFHQKGIQKGTYENCQFQDCNFSTVSLAHINFVDCQFNDCDFSNAKINRNGISKYFF